MTEEHIGIANVTAKKRERITEFCTILLSAKIYDNLHRTKESVGCNLTNTT